MKTPEDEAFDDMARRQGMWGGGYQAKRQAAMDKINSHFDAEYKKMHEDRAKLFEDQMNYGSSWSKNGERIDPASVYFEQPVQEPPKYAIRAYWEADGRIGVVSTVERPDGGVHLLNAIIDPPQPVQEPDALTIAYQSGYHDGKKAALATREWNFCERCGKRTKDMFTIHTCTPPQGAA